MANALVTITLPTARTDGTAATAADYGGAHIFRSDDAGVTFNKIGTVLAPALTFTDNNVPVGAHQYDASVFDVQTPPVESAASANVEFDVAAVLAPLAAPIIAVTAA